MSALVVAAVHGVVLMGGLWPFGGDDHQAPDGSETIATLDERDVELGREPIVPGGAAAARDQYRQFLEISTDQPALQLEAARRLGDLNLIAGQDAETTDQPETAAAYYAEAVKLYTALLEANPGYAGRDKILYQLSRAFEATGDAQQAMQTLDRLVIDHAESRYFGEAQFRRGEMLFVAGDYAAAAGAYAAVIGIGPASPFYQQSLYKHGWAMFKRGRHEDGLNSFMDLLDARLAGAGDANRALAQMPRAQRELLDDTLRVLAISFSYLDGYRSVDALLARRGETVYDNLLYAALGDLYLDKERYQDAAETYSAFVTRAPIDDHAPALQQRVIEAYELAKFPSLVLEAKREYVELYGLDSPFWPHRMRAEWQPVVDQLKVHLTDLASYDHAKAQADDDPAAYDRAANWYRRFIAYFPDDPDSGQRNFLLAQILYELGRYGEASAEYLRTAYDYGVHENAAEAGYAAIVSAGRHEATLSGESLMAWRAEAVENALRFAQTFPGHEQAAPVLTHAAEDFFADGQLARAREVAGQVIGLQPPAPMELERTAWTVIAHANFDLQAYADAERAYQRLLLMPLAHQSQRAEFQDRVAASVYRQAEQAQAAGDVDLAVAEFLRVGAVQPGSDIVPTAIFDAGALLITAERWADAVDVLERFRARYPRHDFNDEVTRKLAFAYESAGRPARAAAEYEHIAKFAGADPELRREALWQAADLYAQHGAPAEQRRVYAEIVARFPEPFAESLEAKQKLADLAKQANDWTDRQKWLRALVAADAAAGANRSTRSQTLAARAKLELAAPERDAFLAVKLTIPLEHSLKLKKQRMEAALAAYGQAVDYGIADVTTAATFEIAELYYGLSQDLMHSERPAELDAEELEQYEILLEEQAFPFEEQAIDIFASNAARSSEGVYDEWVRRSFVRLAELMPARYAKSERSENIVAVLD